MLELFSEPYSPLGNISGEGLSRVLGTPALDPLSVVVRESVQNSWDAALDDRRATFRMHLRTLESRTLEVMRTAVFTDLPAGSAHYEKLSEYLERGEGLRVLEIADFGTSGLGGPSRADVVTTRNEATDFADFIRNIGSARDTAMGGGTYGYGKSSLYRASACATILVHSRAMCAGHPVERFIGCQLSPQYTVDSGPAAGHYTGRHWWGRLADDGVVDPLEGHEAARLASGLGMPARDRGRSGTTIWIIAPDIEAESAPEIMARLEQSLLFNFWPKMVAPGPESNGMDFELMHDGVEYPVRSPESVPPLHLYVEAYRAMKQSVGATASSHPEECDDVHRIECQRPKQLLGLIGLKRGLRKERIGECTDGIAKPIRERSHHIALMRPAELIVRYLPGPALDTDTMEYAGVFIADPEVESAYARSEPPAHDDWIPDGLEKGEATLVRVGLRRIRETVEAYTGWNRGSNDGVGDRVAVSALSDYLGGLIIGGPSGRRVGVKKKRGKKRRKSAQGTGERRRQPWDLRQPQPFDLQVIDGTPAALFRFQLRCENEAAPLVTGQPSVVIEGGREEATASGARPVVLRWILEDGESTEGAECRVPTGYRGQVVVAVSMPDRCAVDLRVTARRPECDSAAPPAFADSQQDDSVEDRHE
ncbi:MAG: hypothetical protein Phyf2KO_11240 [Phycisphaerales bacterium]